MAVYVCKLQLWGKDGVQGGRRRFVFVFSVLPDDGSGGALPGATPRILRVHVCVDPTVLESAHWSRLEHRELLAQVYSFARERLERCGPIEEDELRFIIDEYTDQGRFLDELPAQAAYELGLDFPIQAQRSSSTLSRGAL